MIGQAKRRDRLELRPRVTLLIRQCPRRKIKNVPAQFTPDDARHFYDRFGSWQDTQRFYENPAIDDLVKHTDLEHARSVMEFGCGTGSFARRLLETVLPPD